MWHKHRRRLAEYPNHVWSYDFVMERTQDGRPLNLRTVVDEYTRECLAIAVRRRLISGNGQEVLSELFLVLGCQCIFGPIMAQNLSLGPCELGTRCTRLKCSSNAGAIVTTCSVRTVHWVSAPAPETPRLRAERLVGGKELERWPNNWGLVRDPWIGSCRRDRRLDRDDTGWHAQAHH